MPKKISITMLFTVMAAIIALFAAADVMAQCTDTSPPQQCTAGTGGLQFTVYPYTDPDHPFPFPVEAGETYDGVLFIEKGYVWRYTIEGPTSKLGHVMHFIPYRCDDPIRVVAHPPNGAWFAPCVGDSNTGYGAGICDGIVVTLQYQVETNKIARGWFATNKELYGLNSLGVHVGPTKVLGCVATETVDGVDIVVGGIIGPGYDIAEWIPSNLEQIIQVGQTTIGVRRHPVTGCIKCFFDPDASGRPCLPWDAAPPEWVEGFLQDCGDLSGMNRHCRECVMYVHGSPGCYWAYSEKRWKCICCYPGSCP